ncbi:MAG: tyrosine-protein phosphatase [Spirochaetaceae bacterium]|nr:tyrosine-protein phosphatase [Spirochaetaceae bacterium]
MVFLGLCFSLSHIMAAENNYSQVRGTVATVSKYGNLEMDIKPSELTDAGYEFGDILNITIGEDVILAPFCTSYSDVDTGNPLVRDDKTGDVLIVAINMGNFSKTNSVGEGDILTFSMKEKGAYLNEYLLRQLKRSNVRADYASDSIFANFRNIPFDGIAPNVLYRSSSPVNNEINRAAYSDRLTEAFKIATVINLADSSADIEGYFGADDFNSPYYKSLYDAGMVKNLDMGVDFTSDSFEKKLVEGLKFMIDNEGPYLVHCTEGKDRAGFVSALLEALMGISPDKIISDYMRTYQNYYGVEKDSEQYNAIAKSNIITSMSYVLLGEKKALDLSGIDLTDLDLSSQTESYFQSIGLSSEDITALKIRLSTAPAIESLSVSGTVKEIEKYGHTSTDIKIEDFYNKGFKLGDMVTVTYDNGYTLEAPFLDGYYVENGMPLVRAYPGHENIAICINYGKIYQVADVNIGDTFTISLSRKAAYLDEYSIRSLSRTNKREDYSSDSVFANFRTVTEGDISSRILYRSSSPVNPELGRASYADELVRANHIATVVNLADTRNEVEEFISADGFDSPGYADLFKNGKVATLGMDLAYNGDQFKSGVAQAGKFILANEPPYLIHCTEGKDRAGFVSAMFEALMNATIEEIVADYMTSYTNYYGVTPGSKKYQIISKDVINMLKSIGGTDDLSKVDLPSVIKAYLMEGGMTSLEVDRLKLVLSGVPEQAIAHRVTHSVISGDTLWDLSYKYLGTGFRYNEIYKANQQIIKNPGLIFVGQEFIIPPK